MYVHSIYFFTGSKSNGHVKTAVSATTNTTAAAVSSSISGINRKRKGKL